ncbi:hypothetical protein KR032_008272 [Drosophila birchii]|nr:hypothetical protein KR032_008272 [Drosophila birchii]
MDNLPMKLDLSNFFKDERRQSLVFIDADWQNIKDVQDHIQNLFKLKDINLLTTDGCFLPPRESIQVLKGAQGLKAFRFSAPEQNDFASPAPVTKPSKKRKYTSAEEEVELPSSTPNRPSKRSKRKSSIVPEIAEVTVPDLSIGAFEFPLRRSSQNSTKYDKSNEEPSSSGRSSSKSSRTLRNKSLEVAEADQETLEEGIACQPIVFRCPLMELDSNTKRTFDLPANLLSKIVIIENIEIMPANGIHVELAPAEETVETTAHVIEAEPLVADEEASENVEPKADEEPEETGQTDQANATEAETTQIEEKVEPKDISQSPVAPPAPSRFCAESLSSDSDDDDVMVLDDTNVDDSDSDVQAVAPTEATRSSDIIQDMMRNSIPLDELPSRGDSILFKLLKVKGNPSSGATNLLAGNCTYVNRRSKVITLEVISCPSEYKRILRQYCSLDESGDEVRCLNVNFKDLRDTMIIVDTID